MKVLLISVILMAVTLIGGCGPETAAAGGGLLGGFAASETLKGMQADLELRQQALIDRYNELVEAGADAETIEQLKQQIEDMVRLRQTADLAKQALETDWTDPAAVGGTIGAIAVLAASLAGNFIQKRKGDLMKKTTKAIVKGIEAAEVEEKANPTSPVKCAIEYQMKSAGIYSKADDLVNQLKISR